MDRVQLLTLATALHRQGRLEEAEATYAEVLAKNPRDYDALQLTGLICYQRGDYARAIDLMERAIKNGCRAAYVRVNLGAAYKAVGQLSLAQEQYRAALKLEPNSHDAHKNLANVLQLTGDATGTLKHLARAIAVAKDSDSHSNLLLTLNLLEQTTTSEIAREHRAWGEAHPALSPHATHTNDRDPTRKLRVGYVSADLRTHSVAFFFAPLLSAHDRSRVETVCYQANVRVDETTERLRGLSDEWVEIFGLSDEEVAARVRQDRIDVLVDLSGHSAGNRLGVFARAPAPVQVTWLGYPNTTGLSTVGYRITDAIADPEGPQDATYTEKLCRLPHGFLCYEPWATAPEVSELPAFAHGNITFGSFSNLAKVGPQVIETWSRIIKEVQGSKLMLKAAPFADPGVRRLFEAKFKAHGIPPRRLKLLAEAPTIDEHLARYREVDIGLDPFPYCGTTTTCEAFWMGVPVVSLVGERHASRVGLDLLTRLGLAELAAADRDAYVKCAVELSTKREALARLRGDLRGRMLNSPLCDKAGFARELEAAYRSIWAAWCVK
ncbi:MAG: tetratricopeptide repeat protein [Polyangiaceae bacterium]|nr:tetratricopeptide repeat protein [Polyangiaceae bacterium]